MNPLIVLLAAFTITLIIIKIKNRKYEWASSGRIAMSVMLIFTSVAHFAYTKGMAMMLPEFIPYKTEVIYLTGIIEISAAVGLLIPRLRLLTAWLLIAFFISILPANIYAAMKHVDFQEASYDGQQLNYLWFRVPLQVLFIVWTYFSAIKNNTKKPADY